MPGGQAALQVDGEVVKLIELEGGLEARVMLAQRHDPTAVASLDRQFSREPRLSVGVPRGSEELPQEWARRADLRIVWRKASAALPYSL